MSKIVDEVLTATSSEARDRSPEGSKHREPAAPSMRLGMRHHCGLLPTSLD
jgi:hypothetical protein